MASRPASNARRAPASKQAKTKQIVVKLKDVRASFLHCFVPQTGEDDNGQESKPAYTGHFILSKEHPQFRELQKAMVDVAKAKFGEANGVNVLKELMRSNRTCLRNGNTKTDPDGRIMEGYEGMHYLSARSYVKPRVVDRNKNIELTERDGRPYSGCYVNAILAIWAQSGKFGKRINAQMQGVQFVRDGDAFGSGRAASVDDFDDLADEFDDDDLTGEFDDDIPY